MSSPPEYQPRTSGEATPFLSKSGRADDDEHGLETAYPPRQVDGGASSGQRRINMTYTFKPVYPVKGVEESVLGVLGHDRESTTEIVQRAFPVLAEYPSDRIEFHVPIDSGGQGSTQWGIVLDEAWDQMVVMPPARLQVTVKDGPGDERARNMRELRIALMIAAVVLIVVVGIFIAAAVIPNQN